MSIMFPLTFPLNSYDTSCENLNTILVFWVVDLLLKYVIFLRDGYVVAFSHVHILFAMSAFREEKQ